MLGDARGMGDSSVNTIPTNDDAVAANAIDTHPTLVFKKDANGTRGFPGDTTP